MGYDPRVSFHSAYYLDSSTKVVVCLSNSEGAYDISQGIKDVIKSIRKNVDRKMKKKGFSNILFNIDDLLIDSYHNAFF